MRRASLLLAGFLLLSACAAPARPGSPTTAPSAADAVTVHVLDFKILPVDITVRGPRVTLIVINDGPTVHNVTIRDSSGKLQFATRDLRPGETETISGTLTKGRYVTFCSLPGHESLGTKGSLTVTG